MRVYCIDDDQAILRWLVSKVDWECYDCQVVGYSTKPGEVLAYLERERVDLLITDISMPEMTGLELIKEAKERCPGIAVIIISAYSEFRYVKEALRYGVINYLLKPIDTDELYDCLKIAVSIYERQRNHSRQQRESTFQDSILYQLIMGGYDEEQFIEKCTLAGIRLEEQVFRVMVLEVQEGKREEIWSLAEKFSCQGLGGYYCFWDANMKLVLLAMGTMEGMNNLENIIFEFMSYDGERGLFVCMGECLEEYRKLTESYQSCCDFANARMLFREKVVKLEEYNYQRYQAVLREEKLQDLTNALEKGGEDGIARCMWRLVEGKHSQERRKEMMCLGVFVVKNVKQAHPSLEIKETAETLEDQHTTSQMINWINNFYTENSKAELEKEKYSYVNLMIREVVEHYGDKELSLQMLAGKCGVTPPYLGKLFYGETGEFFHDYLIRTRLNAAEKMLVETDKNIGEISGKVGFSSQSYFNRVFLKKYRMSPMEYRNRLRSRERQ